VLALILATLAIGTPTTCAAPQAWPDTIRQAYAGTARADDPTGVWAFYVPIGHPLGGGRIVLGPVPCMMLRNLTRRSCDRALVLEGLATLGHEVEHARQDDAGELFDYATRRAELEAQAERVGQRRAPGWLRRLEKVFGPCRPFVSVAPVRLAP
jgi:hypothetical protein